jgi:hypothetical protein
MSFSSHLLQAERTCMMTSEEGLGGTGNVAVWLVAHWLSRCTCSCWKIKWLCLKHFLWDGILEWAQGTYTGTASWESLPKAGGCSLYKLLLLEWFFFFFSSLLTESKPLRQNAQEMACGSMRHILLCICVYGFFWFPLGFWEGVFVRT